MPYQIYPYRRSPVNVGSSHILSISDDSYQLGFPIHLFILMENTGFTVLDKCRIDSSFVENI